MKDGQDDAIVGWFAGRLPDGWFTGPLEVSGDGEEILVVGSLPEVELEGGTPESLAAAREARIERFREETRQARMRIASEAEHRFRTKVSWGASCGEVRRLFTTVSVPVMTRLRLSERGVLDTLIAAGVARSRSDALAWCVRLVGKHQADWIEDLRRAFAQVEKVRSEGPKDV